MNPEIEYVPERGLKFAYTYETMASAGHPDVNEDSVYSNPGRGLALLLDGAGGHENGAAASRTGMKSLERSLSNINSNDPNVVAREMERAFKSASREIGADVPKGYTTALAVKIVESGGRYFAVIASVGDSRAYLFRKGKLEQLTTDDGVVPEDRPDISRRLDNVLTQADYNRLTPEERNMFDDRNVINSALGGHFQPIPKVSVIELLNGDQILNTSDGVHDNVTFGEIEQAMAEGRVDIAKELVWRSRMRSEDPRYPRRAKSDDMTALVISAETGKKPVNLGMEEVLGMGRRYEDEMKRYLAELDRKRREEGAVSSENLRQVEFNLYGDKRIEVEYHPGHPVEIIIGDRVLRIGVPAELFSGKDGFFFMEQEGFIIADLRRVRDSKGDTGFKGLREGEPVVLGRNHEVFGGQRRFSFDDTVSGEHVRLSIRGNKILVENLSQTGETIVKSFIEMPMRPAPELAKPARHDLSGGKEVTFTFFGKPIEVALAGSKKLLIATPTSFGFQGLKDTLIIIDPAEMASTKGEGGFVFMSPNSSYVLGRLVPPFPNGFNPSERFHFGDNISKQHVEISWLGKDRIRIRDLQSTNGTVAQQ